MLQTSPPNSESGASLFLHGQNLPPPHQSFFGKSLHRLCPSLRIKHDSESRTRRGLHTHLYTPTWKEIHCINTWNNNVGGEMYFERSTVTQDVCTLLCFDRKRSTSAAINSFSLQYFLRTGNKEKAVVETQLTSPPWGTPSPGCPCHRPPSPARQTENCRAVYRHGEISLWRQTHMYGTMRMVHGRVTARVSVGVHS